MWLPNKNVRFTGLLKLRKTPFIDYFDIFSAKKTITKVLSSLAIWAGSFMSRARGGQNAPPFQERDSMSHPRALPPPTIYALYTE
jgi:hypothetical protein